VELDGVRIDKPFVEKPASGEDHNIHIYYPHSMVRGAAVLISSVHLMLQHCCSFSTVAAHCMVGPQHTHLLPTQHGEGNSGQL
jgi:hypothetical protein